MRIKMKVIPTEDDALRQVVDRGTRADPTVIHGTGPHSFACGGCGAVLLEGVRFGQVESVLFRCAGCGAVNATPQIMGGDDAGER